MRLFIVSIDCGSLMLHQCVAPLHKIPEALSFGLGCVQEYIEQRTEEAAAGYTNEGPLLDTGVRVMVRPLW